jgi:hypothetical protein
MPSKTYPVNKANGASLCNPAPSIAFSACAVGPPSASSMACQTSLHLPQSRRPVGASSSTGLIGAFLNAVAAALARIANLFHRAGTEDVTAVSASRIGTSTRHVLL